VGVGVELFVGVGVGVELDVGLGCGAGGRLCGGKVLGGESGAFGSTDEGVWFEFELIGSLTLISEVGKHEVAEAHVAIATNREALRSAFSMNVEC
jgi:hypothetical protein